MTLPILNLENQFGEVSTNAILDGGANLANPIAAGTILSNLTAGSAAPIGNTKQAIANILPAKAGVTAISAESAADAVTITLATDDTYSDAAVNTAVNAALVSVVAEINAAITQLNAVLAALKVVS